MPAVEFGKTGMGHDTPPPQNAPVPDPTPPTQNAPVPDLTPPPQNAPVAPVYDTTSPTNSNPTVVADFHGVKYYDY